MGANMPRAQNNPAMALTLALLKHTGVENFSAMQIKRNV